MAPQKWKLTFWCGLLVFGGLQVAPGPGTANPPVHAERTIQAQVNVPPQVARLLERSCMDCHSNQTRWPWYSRVAPGSWFVQEDVTKARKAMNFSEWPQAPASMGLLMAACAVVQTDRMPLKQYLWLHPSARLSAEDKQTLCDWSAAEARRLRATTRASRRLVTASGTLQQP